MKGLPQIQADNYDKEMRAIAASAAVVSKLKKKPSKTLVGDAVDLLREEIAGLEKELSALRLKALAHDRKEAASARTARAAAEDADILLEVVSLFAQTITNEKREWRKVREQARKLLEDRGIPPPTTLGSSRNRRKTGRKAPSPPEST